MSSPMCAGVRDGKVDMLDITDAQAVSDAVGSLRPGVIVNCAAYTDVDKAEDEPEKADLLNRMAVGNLAAAARDSGAVLIHVSTDYVFGKGSCNVPLREDSAGTPACVYGHTKLLGEEAVKASGLQVCHNAYIMAVQRIRQEFPEDHAFSDGFGA